MAKYKLSKIEYESFQKDSSVTLPKKGVTFRRAVKFILLIILIAMGIYFNQSFSLMTLGIFLFASIMLFIWAPLKYPEKFFKINGAYKRTWDLKFNKDYIKVKNGKNQLHLTISGFEPLKKHRVGFELKHNTGVRLFIPYSSLSITETKLINKYA